MVGFEVLMGTSATSYVWQYMANCPVRSLERSREKCAQTVL